MNIVFAVNDAYCDYLCVTITSILENNRKHSITFFILSSDFSNASQCKINNLCSKYQNAKAIFITPNDNLFSNLNISIDYISKETFYRYAIADLLPEEKKALYLDADIVVTGDLDTLYNTDIKDYHIAGVKDLHIERHDYKKNIGLEKNDLYVNAGVLLFNLDKLREKNYSKILIEKTKELNGKISYQDQDIINIVFKGTIKEIDSIYNFASSNAKRESKKSSKAIIIHYTGKYKPWHNECKNQLKSVWGGYLNKYATLLNKTQYARLFIHYKYKIEKGWNRDGNIGDCIQNLAVENIYKKANISNLKLINRDEIDTYDGACCSVVMQSWFSNSRGIFPLPWTDKLFPIFLGFHLGNGGNSRKCSKIKCTIEKMKHIPYVGCRDRNTRDFLLSKGINAYFSGCMTLTFDKREKTPENGKIFVVDLDKAAIKKLPKDILDKADFSISHVYYWNKYPINYDDAISFENRARDILEIYKNQASMIITSKIHVAMPCIAMGIPVVFICKNPNDIRFDVLQGIIPIYLYKDIKYVNWEPVAPDINELKSAIIKNAIAQITDSDNKLETINTLNTITSKLKPINYLPKHILYLRKFINLLK